ncbi:hypothetical protein FA95DRAFT_1607344 [Auriscalpium vulgare]|uniref:Uncharacterized protein n=1 Tax=Auriscalpium vulgare TaxID=40419 RepID=A0ACB8RP00_9AGAM|nr:hypothetical protein FA95DRAFT_1607344 [Auriscalpium vulgare]
MSQTPSLIVMSIGATRIYRALSDSTAAVLYMHVPLRHRVRLPDSFIIAAATP